MGQHQWTDHSPERLAQLSGHKGRILRAAAAKASSVVGPGLPPMVLPDVEPQAAPAVKDSPATTTAAVWTSMPTSKYPAELGKPGPFAKWIMFSAMSGRHVGRKGMAERNGADRTVAAVELYIPEGALKSESRALYDETEVGAFMGLMSEFTAQTNADLIGAVARGVTDITNIAEGALEQVMGSQGMFGAIGAGAGGATDVVMSAGGHAWDFIKDIAKEAGGAVSNNLVSQALFAGILNKLSNFSPGVLEQIAGQRVNTRTDVLFSNMGYRTHEFNYMLIPRSLDEAIAIDQIIHMFQFYMLPNYSPDINGNLAGTMIGFPYEFEISFWTEDQASIHHINKIGRSVLTSVAIDHTAGGNVAFYKGPGSGEVYPAATTLTLSFMEVRLLARDSPEINRGGMGPGYQVDPNARLTGLGLPAAVTGPGAPEGTGIWDPDADYTSPDQRLFDSELTRFNERLNPNTDPDITGMAYLRATGGR